MSQSKKRNHFFGASIARKLPPRPDLQLLIDDGAKVKDIAKTFKVSAAAVYSELRRHKAEMALRESK